MTTRTRLGCIADDITGGTDLANEFSSRGVRVVQIIGVPAATLAEAAGTDDFDVVVVGLKTRTAPREVSVRESLRALAWLRSQGCDRFYVKYCSTFDSRPEGNIGPVLDAVMDDLGVAFTVACPASPDNGRTVYRGHLFVGDQLLAESSMRHHPLTPMRDSSVVRLLQAQTRRRVELVGDDLVRQGPEVLTAELSRRASQAGIAVVDATSRDDLVSLGAAAAAAQLPLLSGAAGLAAGLATWFEPDVGVGPAGGAWVQPDSGAQAVVAGSRSPATAEQIRRMSRQHPHYTVDPIGLEQAQGGGQALVDDILTWARAHLDSGPVLVHPALAEPAESDDFEPVGAETAAALEAVLAAVAVGLVEAGVRRLVVAGGETSGAVVNALAPTALSIGPQISPGVPWTTCLGDLPRVALVCKSGNFGEPDFFARAWNVLP